MNNKYFPSKQGGGCKNMAAACVKMASLLWLLSDSKLRPRGERRHLDIGFKLSSYEGV